VIGATRLSDLAATRVAVWGAGREGRAAVDALTAMGCELVLVVDAPDPASNDLAAAHGLALHRPAEVESLGVDFVVRSPGIPRYRPEVARWRAAGIGCSGLLALWLADRDPEGVIGVTGTKGKSTTASLLTAVLSAAGRDVHLAGNIGVPVTVIPGSAEVAVVEVSSYQASDCTSSPSVGVLTALGEDHVSWHGSVEQYHADKLNLFAHPGLRAMVAPVARDRLGALGVTAFVDGPWRNEGAVVIREGDAAVDAGSIPVHVRRNLVLAANAAEAWSAGIRSVHVATAVAGFEPLPSRQRLIDTVNGVRWVDDLLASNPTGVAAALESFAGEKLILLMGGDDRGIDLAPLVADLSAASNLEAIVLMGGDSETFVRTVGAAPLPIVRVSSHDIDAAVRAAHGIARPGWTVSFSPGAPTPKALGDWESRSRMFAAAVAALPR